MKLWRLIKPPKPWRPVVAILVGMILGIGIAAFYVSNAVSYLSEDPAACVNCHIMTPQYATWFHSSHRQWATCNDCHVPHDNVFNKYRFKAQDGLRHATMFTLRLEPFVIRIHDPGKGVVQDNCIRCHTHQVLEVKGGRVSFKDTKHGEGKVCWDCHREVPHGSVNSIASTPYARIPAMTPVVPEWIQKITNNNK